MTAIAFEVQPKSNTKYFAVSEFDGGIPSAYLKMIMFMSTLWKYSTNCKCNISRDSFGFPSYQYNLIRMFPFRSIREYVSKEREKNKGKKSEAVLCWCKFWHFQETESDVVFLHRWIPMKPFFSLLIWFFFFSRSNSFQFVLYSSYLKTKAMTMPAAWPLYCLRSIGKWRRDFVYVPSICNFVFRLLSTVKCMFLTVLPSLYFSPPPTLSVSLCWCVGISNAIIMGTTFKNNVLNGAKTMKTKLMSAPHYDNCRIQSNNASTHTKKNIYEKITRPALRTLLQPSSVRASCHFNGHCAVWYAAIVT